MTVTVKTTCLHIFAHILISYAGDKGQINGCIIGMLFISFCSASLYVVENENLATCFNFVIFLMLFKKYLFI